MAMSHDDFMHQSGGMDALMQRLQEKADKLTTSGANKITAGTQDEAVIAEQVVGQVHIIQRPHDKDCLRISIGEPNDVKLKFGEPSVYFVFRGDRQATIELMERALAAIKASHFEQFPYPDDVV